MARSLSVIILLCLLTASSATFNFLIHGDWGWNSENQTKVAEKMGFFGNLIDAKFVIALVRHCNLSFFLALMFHKGDNFYEAGVDNTTDKKWDYLFHDVYNAESLQVPWYPVLGNHDYRANIQAQIERTYETGETVWNFPATYYVKNHGLEDGGLLSIVYIDTQILDPDHDDTQIIFNHSNWEQEREDHLDWIESTLRAQYDIATWLIVVGHYPIYSVGVNSDNQVLLSNLNPLLEKYHVHMYIAGHDHNHQYITMPSGVTHVVSGQGSGRGPFGHSAVSMLGVSASTNYIRKYFSDCGFAYAEVDSERFTTVFVDVDGEIRYTSSMTNPLHAAERDEGTGTDYYKKIKDFTSTVESSHYGIIFIVALPTVLLTVALFLVVHRNSIFSGGRASSVRAPSSIDDSIRSNIGLTSDYNL